jgi:hypothetical protein
LSVSEAFQRLESYDRPWNPRINPMPKKSTAQPMPVDILASEFVAFLCAIWTIPPSPSPSSLQSRSLLGLADLLLLLVASAGFGNSLRGLDVGLSRTSCRKN